MSFVIIRRDLTVDRVLSRETRGIRQRNIDPDENRLRRLSSSAEPEAVFRLDA
ncbi:MAG: hypothetical protein H6685_00180 [Deltaproteobacteria bacterium]|nr:hypothetical protein [Deltaproteobacteria bacterium]